MLIEQKINSLSTKLDCREESRERDFLLGRAVPSTFWLTRSCSLDVAPYTSPELNEDQELVVSSSSTAAALLLAEREMRLREVVTDSTLSEMFGMEASGSNEADAFCPLFRVVPTAAGEPDLLIEGLKDAAAGWRAWSSKYVQKGSAEVASRPNDSRRSSMFASGRRRLQAIGRAAQ